jgi:pyruvate,orthophosphate dikinase
VREAICNGVDGVGIFHTENLFFKPPAFQQFQNYLLSKSMEDRKKILVQIQTFHEQDLLRLFRVTRTRRIAIELLDSSLSKFLPSPNVGNKQYEYEVNELARTDTAACDKTIRSLQLSNPLIGSIGCPVGIIYPEIISMQVESILGNN